MINEIKNKFEQWMKEVYADIRMPEEEWDKHYPYTSKPVYLRHIKSELMRRVEEAKEMAEYRKYVEEKTQKLLELARAEEDRLVDMGYIRKR